MRGQRMKKHAMTVVLIEKERGERGNEVKCQWGPCGEERKGEEKFEVIGG